MATITSGSVFEDPRNGDPYLEAYKCEVVCYLSENDKIVQSGSRDQMTTVKLPKPVLYPIPMHRSFPGIEVP